MSEMDWSEWPDCAMPHCPRKCCLALDSIYCFPHTKGNKHVKHWKIDARNADPMIHSALKDTETQGR